MRLTSPSFDDGEQIPTRHTADGADRKTVEAALDGHVMATAELTGIYQR